MDMERGIVQMVPLIALIVGENTEVAVAVPETIGPLLLQMKSMMQKCYAARWSCFLTNLLKQ